MNAELKTTVGRELRSNCQDINNILTTETVHPYFQTHWFDLETGEHGIKNLICKILAEAEATFELGIENGALRSIAIAASLLTDEIIESVQSHFTDGSTRYPATTIRHYLSTVLFKNGIIGKIQMNASEDTNKPKNTCRSRCKWYLVK